MAVSIDNTKVVYRGQPTTSIAALYTAQNSGEIIKEIRVVNTTGSAATVSLFAVPAGGTAGVTNAIMYNKSIPANDYLVDAATVDLAVGDFIAGSQGTSGITVTITNYQK